MAEKRYICGYDFGTLSCRLLVTELDSGEAVFERSMEYPSGVITGQLPGGAALPGRHWCLQDPDDYLTVMEALTRSAGEQVDVRRVAAIGTDFTNCTMVALGQEGQPLCRDEKFRRRPHAWVKLWKHHAAQPHAERMERYLSEAGTDWFGYYGGKVSSEWLFPKLLEVYEEDREVYDAAAVFLEAADYIVYRLTGKLVRNSATLGVNAFYDPLRGLPSSAFFRALSPGWEETAALKLAGEIRPVGSRAGGLTEAAAARLGLCAGTVVAVGHGDSEVAAAGFGITEPGTMLMVMGTSTCYQMLHTEKKAFPGVCSIVRDGMIPGLTAYESGQPAVGDAFAWYAEHMMPDGYVRAAERTGRSRLAYMDALAERLRPGQSGLVSLDWFNGNRSVLMNYHLRAFLAGLTLDTKPEHIYRSFLEATAFGARKILEGYDGAGVPIKRVCASGGLAHKSPVTMQLYADILEREVTVSSLSNVSAMGACVCGAVAYEAETGTREGFQAACRRMVHYDTTVYRPDQASAELYRQLYGVFCKLHDFAGVTSDLCSELLRIQTVSNRTFEE